jgi:hypothetical protein
LISANHVEALEGNTAGRIAEIAIIATIAIIAIIEKPWGNFCFCYPQRSGATPKSEIHHGGAETRRKPKPFSRE